MKQYFLIGCFLLGILPLLSSQEFNNDFGQVGRADVDLEACPFDKNADAVVISDLGTSYFERTDNSFDLIYSRTTRLKIFREAGIEWANIEIPYYQRGDIYEEVFDVGGCTYNVDQGLFFRSVLDLKSCKEEKVNEYWNQKKFAMPNVKVGSIIEYTYKVRSQFLFNLRDWDFQWKIPVISSMYVTKMIPFYQYIWLLQGATKFNIQKSYADEGLARQFGNVNFKDMIYEYGMKNVPAFKDEQFIASPENYLIKLNFQLSRVIETDGAGRNVINTWPELIKDMLKEDEFGGYSKKSEGLASKIFDMQTFSLLTAQEKFDSVMNYVKSNYSWNSKSSKYASKNPKAFMKDKFGNAADINLFTVGLLNAAGVKAYPVIISTRNNGKIKYDYPFLDFFNYVIILAEIDAKNVLADATISLSSNDRIAEKCINDKGLVIQKDKVEWLGLQTLVPSKMQKTIQITLTDSSQNAAIQSSSTEYIALDYRNDFGANTRIIKKYLMDKGYSVVDSSIVVKNQTSVKDPYIFKYCIEDRPEKVNDKIYVAPFLHEVIDVNPLKQIDRTYPIDMTYPKRMAYFAQMNLPEGYKVDFLPANVKIKNEMFELEYLTSTTENKINVSLVYYFKIPVYEATEYSKLKYYFNEIVNKGSEKIVFVKN